MKRKLLAIITACILSVSCTVQAMQKYEGSYIKNGSFDNNLDGWTQKWQSGTSGTLEVIKVNDNNVVHMKSDNGRCYIRQTLQNVCEGDKLNLSFRMKIASLAEGATALITFGYKGKDGNTSEEHHNYEVANPDIWAYKSIDFIVPENTESVYILARLNYGGEVYYDDFDVTDFDNKTHLTVTSKGMEMFSIPDGLNEVTAKLHYVPEYQGESGSIVFAVFDDKKLVSTSLKPFTANKTVSMKANMDIPSGLKNPLIKAYVWRNGESSDPISMTVSLPREGRSEVYDIFAVDKMRGVYDGVALFYDTERQQKLVDLGINTFIYNIIGKFNGGDINKDPEALDAVCADMEKYIEETGVHIFMKASFGSNSVVSNSKFGAYHPGKEHKLTLPCPLSEEYWNAEMLSRLEVVAKHPKIEGAVFDMEMYNGGSTRYPASCFCDSCVEKYVAENSGEVHKKLANISPENREEYIVENKIEDKYNSWFKESITAITTKVRQRLHEINPNLIIGVMPDMERIPGLSKGLGTKEMPLVVFLEKTYWGEIGKLNMYQALAKMREHPVIFAVGLWCNEEESITVRDFASKIKEAYPNDLGYWIYSGGQIENEPKYYDQIGKANKDILNNK